MSNKLPNGWKECKLEEVAKIVGGSTPKTDIDEYWNGDIPWITPKDLSNFNGRYISKGERNISEKGLVNSSAKLLPPGTILLTSRAPVGYLAIAENEITTNQGFRSLVPLNNIDNIFLFYLLKNNIEYLKSQATGTTFGELAGSVLKSLVFLFPPLPEQRAIASVLSSLDDKIDLLHRENKTLEAMAETLFRQWFIEEAEKGWKEIKLEKYVECVTGCSYKSIDLNPSNIALVTLKNFARDGSFRMDGFKEYTGDYKKSQIVKQGDLVVAHTDITQEGDIIGNPVLIINPGQYKTLVITMDLMKVESTTEWLSKEFLYYLFKTPDFKFHCLGCSNGTTVLHMSRNAIPSYELKIPNKEKVIAFTKRVRPIIEKKFTNIFQIRTLEKLRDTLLPKLMSGEVRIQY